MKLLIVESPSKINTIKRYLPKDYEVLASNGHVVELSTRGKGGFGIDTSTFEGEYVIDSKKEKVVSELRKAAKNSSEIIMATDPDREGEAIAYHLTTLFNLPVETTKRLEFNEITKDAILNALEHPRTINLDLFKAQEARRMLDRIVGFSLSGLLQSKIKEKSAGRVQSAVLKILVDKEEEIKAFIPEEYWTFKVITKKDNEEFDLLFNKAYNGKNKISSEEEKQDIESKLAPTVTVSEKVVEQKDINTRIPFTTSTLQQEAYAKFGYRTKKTAEISQKLYEGVSINGEQTGLVTYIRTDSTRLSPTFLAHASTYIAEHYGTTYLSKQKTSAKANQKIQDAHEAIRPTDLNVTPNSVQSFLSKEQYNLYKLIYFRTLASLFPNGKEEVTRYKFNSNGTLFSASANKILFDGFLKVYGEFENKVEKALPTMYIGDELPIVKVESEQKFSEPPKRYSEGRIVNKMEELGIGRPSTYSSTIDTLTKRKYVTSTKGTLTPTESGIKTIEALSEHFSSFISSDYTAAMERDLDKIASVELGKQQFLTTFYEQFSVLVNEAKANIPKLALEKIGRACPSCGGDLVKHDGKFGPFIGCSNFPKCKHVESIINYTGEICPSCGHKLLFRFNKKGERFIACSNYPHCTYTDTDKTRTFKKKFIKKRK